MKIYFSDTLKLNIPRCVAGRESGGQRGSGQDHLRAEIGCGSRHHGEYCGLRSRSRLWPVQDQVQNDWVWVFHFAVHRVNIDTYLENCEAAA